CVRQAGELSPVNAERDRRAGRGGAQTLGEPERAPVRERALVAVISCEVRALEAHVRADVLPPGALHAIAAEGPTGREGRIGHHASNAPGREVLEETERLADQHTIPRLPFEDATDQLTLHGSPPAHGAPT